MNFQDYLEKFKFDRLDFEDDFEEFVKKTNSPFALTVAKMLVSALEARMLESVPSEATRLHIAKMAFLEHELRKKYISELAREDPNFLYPYTESVH